MANIETLKKVLTDYKSHECKQVELVWSDGLRSGIGNPQAVKVVMDALLGELHRQLDEAVAAQPKQFEYPQVLTREMEMFKKATKISFDDAIFGDRKALLKKHFSEHPIYLDDSYYAHSDKWPMVEESRLEQLAEWRDCHYYTLYEWEGHRFFVMEGGRYD